LLAATDPRGTPERAQDAARFGAWVENACLAHAWNQGQHVSYWREEPLEVDAVLDGSWGSWAIEVKTGAASATDLRGIAEFTRRQPKYRPLVLCDDEALPAIERAGLPAMPWSEFLLDKPAGADKP
jgi:predicted AAA+ superfamily ATPase